VDGFDENVLHHRRSLQPASEQGEEGSERAAAGDRGEAAYVLVSYAEFQVNWTPKTLFEALRDPSADEREFEPARVGFDNRTVEF
jgi:hypothetical protein